jgi:hypothetical protein
MVVVVRFFKYVFGCLKSSKWELLCWYARVEVTMCIYMFIEIDLHIKFTSKFRKDEGMHECIVFSKSSRCIRCNEDCLKV